MYVVKRNMCEDVEIRLMKPVLELWYTISHGCHGYVKQLS